MSFVVYFLVLLITAGSVLFGLDWVQAPMSPMPASTYELHAARPPPRPEPKAEAKAETAPQPAPVAAAAPPRAAETVAVAQPEPAPAPIAAPEPVAAAAPKCDVDACALAYRSFTSEDCTYQPLDGPRRLCTRGTPPVAAADPAKPAVPPSQDARAQAACNIAACSQAYISFTPADCTYQPLEGPRRLCEK